MSRSRALLALATSVLLLPVLAAGGATAAEPRRAVETWATPGSVAITLTGHGYGHGHGLSQYGAQGAALQGLTWQQIAEFYYPGTAWAEARGAVRVLITADTGRDVQVLAQPGTRVTSLERGRSWRLPPLPARSWRLVGAGSDTLVQRSTGGAWRTWRRVPGEAELTSSSGPLTLLTPSGRHRYRGALQSVATPQGKRLTVNRVGMEAYLRGVVPQEVPALWQPAAVSAQSVAARTYAAFERSHPATGDYDLCDTSQCQVYGGVDVEHPAATDAIRATARQVLTYAGRPAFTQFSASNGGWSSAGSMPYLVAQPDPYDAVDNPRWATWTVVVDDTQVERQWPEVGDLTGIEVTTRDGNGEWGGRVVDLAFTGTGGTVRLDGDTVRTALGLGSTWFTFTVTPRQQGRVRP